MTEIALILILAVLCLCITIASIAEVVDLRKRLAALERKESRRAKVERLQKLRARRK